MATSLNSSGAAGGDRTANAYLDVAAASTDAALVAAQTGKSIRVLAVFANGRDAGGASTFQFNSKPAGAGTAISPVFSVPQHGGFVLPEGKGWFETNAGEGLAVTTQAASAIGLIVVYKIESSAV